MTKIFDMKKISISRIQTGWLVEYETFDQSQMRTYDGSIKEAFSDPKELKKRIEELSKRFYLYEE